MNEIVAAVPDQEPIRLGPDGSGKQISFQEAQDFYNEISGKSERLSEKLRIPFVVTIAEVENLHHRIEQSTEQYNVASSTATFSVKYVGDCSERYSSIDRLKLHGGHKGLPVEEVSIEYKLLIVLPKTRRPQEYTVSVTLASRVAKIEEFRREMDDLPFTVPFHRLESFETGKIAIDFVDIAVAYALMSTIKSWFEGLKATKTNQFFKLVRRKSHYATRISKYAFLALTVYHVNNYAETILVSGVDQKVAVLFTLSSLLSAFLAFRLGAYIGRKSELNLDQVYEMSYIHFSGADERFVDESRAKVAQSMLKSGGALVVALIVGVVSSVIAGAIFSG